MSNLINFYRNLYPANNRKNYYHSDIMKWEEYKLELKKDYIQWLFPNIKKDGNPKAPKLNKDDIKEFLNDKDIRSNVVESSLKILSFYGFVINLETGVKQTKQLVRRENMITMYDNKYKTLSRIMTFLSNINMNYLSNIFFLALCKTIKKTKNLLKITKENRYIKKWISTQPFLVRYYSKTYTPEEKSNTILEKACINGLDFTSNSCYMDSTLLCTFAIPNKTITKLILNKNIDELKNNKILDIKCSDNITTDINIRKNIQKQLIDITQSMRGLKNVKNCTNLRMSLRKCIGTQPFHKGGTQDAGEFLTYLFNIFQVENATEKKKLYGSNEKEWTFIRKQKTKRSPIITIGPYELQSLEGLDITSVINKEEITEFSEDNLWRVSNRLTYNKKRENTNIDAPMLVFKLERRIYPNDILETYVYLPENLTLKKKVLNLSAIVVHDGGAHYTANIKYGDNWWFYDDNPGGKHKMLYIGSYEQMLNNTNNSPNTLGTLFFYT
jgi:ubiquitin C-terminal hydrolase